MNILESKVFVDRNIKTVGEIVRNLQEKGVYLNNGKNGHQVYKDAKTGVAATFDANNNSLRKVFIPNPSGYTAEDFAKGLRYDVCRDGDCFSRTITKANGETDELTMYVENGIVKYAARKDGNKPLIVGRSLKLDFLHNQREIDNMAFEIGDNPSRSYKEAIKQFMQL